MGAVEREALRAQATDLIQRLRSEPSVPQTLWELLDNILRRLDRLELGTFDSQEETPTKPERRVSSDQISAVKPLGERTRSIFEEAKGPKKDGE